MTPDALIHLFRTYLDWCFAHETAPRVQELAQRLGITPWRVTRAVRRVTGYSASKFFNIERVRHAQRLLCAGVPQNRVAYAAGFGTRATFYRVFRMVTGGTPAEYVDRANLINVTLASDDRTK